MGIETQSASFLGERPTSYASIVNEVGESHIEVWIRLCRVCSVGWERELLLLCWRG